MRTAHMANALMAAAAGAPRRNAASTALSPAAQSAAVVVVPEPTQQPNAMDVDRVDRDLPVDPSTVTFLKTKYPAQADAVQLVAASHPNSGKWMIVLQVRSRVQTTFKVQRSIGRENGGFYETKAAATADVFPTRMRLEGFEHRAGLWYARRPIPADAARCQIAAARHPPSALCLAGVRQHAATAEAGSESSRLPSMTTAAALLTMSPPRMRCT